MTSLTKAYVRWRALLRKARETQDVLVALYKVEELRGLVVTGDCRKILALVAEASGVVRDRTFFSMSIKRTAVMLRQKSGDKRDDCPARMGSNVVRYVSTERRYRLAHVSSFFVKGHVDYTRDADIKLGSQIDVFIMLTISTRYA